LLARLKLENNKAPKRFAEGMEDFVAQIIPAFFLAFTNNAKVPKELDHPDKRVPLSWHVLLPALKDLEMFLTIDSRAYIRWLVLSGNRIKHPGHRASINLRYLRPIFVQPINFSRTVLGSCFPD
jgi:hypothetical protein